MSYRLYTADYQLILFIYLVIETYMRRKKRGLLQIAPYMCHPQTPRGTRVYT